MAQADQARPTIARIWRGRIRRERADEYEAYSLEVGFVQRRGKTEAELSLRRGDVSLGDPLGSAGGGVIDVAGFALRLAALMLSQPARRRLLVLDEPFKHLSREYRPAARELLGRLSAELGVQFLVVTHAAEVAILDVTGVPSVDAAVAEALVRATKAVGLLGARVVLTGLGPSAAHALVELDMELGGMTTKATLRDGLAAARKRAFTMRSSPEWYESTATRPPGAVASIAASSAVARISSSRLTSMRIAWNVRFAGCPPRRRAGAGIASRTIEASWRVDSIGRAATIARAMRDANRSSAFVCRMRVSSSTEYPLTTSSADHDTASGNADNTLRASDAGTNTFTSMSRVARGSSVA